MTATSGPAPTGSAPGVADARSNRATWRAVIAAGSGNLLEFYDFAVYAFFATTLAALFFPNADPVVSMLSVFAAYGIGFVARPLGSYVIGRIGDTKGRKPALIVTITCMAIGTIGIGLLPTYQSIGALAPALLVLLRAVQGFATGGEWGTSATFMIEWAPPARRGFFGSFQSVSTSGGALLASAVAAVLTWALPAEAMLGWGWRVPFVAGGAAIFLFGLYMRFGTEETPEFIATQRAPVPLDGARPLLLAVKAFGFTMFWTTLSYLVSAYMVTYTQREAGLTRPEALWASSIALLVQVAAIPLAGALSDRVGRRRLLLTSCISTAVLSYPILSVMSSTGGFGVVLTLQICLALLFALFSGPGPAAICEMFPTRLRTTWMTVGYALAVAIFGGFSPFTATWLIHTTGMAASPAFLLIPAAVVSGLVIAALPPQRAGADTLVPVPVAR